MTQPIPTPVPAAAPQSVTPKGTVVALPPIPHRETELESMAGSSVSPRWVARLSGIDVLTIERMCEDGELVSMRPAGAREQLIPLWQLGEDGKPLASIPLVAAEAKRAGLGPVALHKLMSRRTGLTGGEQLGDLLRAGRVDHVLSVIRASAG